VTTTTHKTLRGPRGGIILCKAEHAKKIDSAIFPGNQGGPLMHIIAAKAVAFQEALAPQFREYQRAIVRNARSLAKALVDRGLVLISGGTDNHLMLIDLRGGELTGRDAQRALDKARITTNCNAVPFDQRPPYITSGLRLGTPAVTTRGMREREMEQVADLLMRGLRAQDDMALAAIGGEVAALCRRFPLYPDRRFAE
jgi:glycine hydroxymethyltransferase